MFASIFIRGVRIAFFRACARITTVSIALSIAGCASLPTYDMSHRSGFSTVHPRIIGQAGPLPRAESDAILRGFDEKGKTSLLEHHLAFTQAIGNAPLVAGNSVHLLIDGPATYQAMFDAIGAARSSIDLESYIFDDDEIGRKFASLLIEKQEQGVQVNLLYDAVGTLGTSSGFFSRMQEKGIHVCEFNPVNPLRGRLFSLNNRDHRKILVVDGETGFTGGVNISRVYSSSIFNKKAKRRAKSGSWRDTHIEVRGPAVAEFQRLFAANWSRQNCGALAPGVYFPELHDEGDTITHGCRSPG